ncbi:MAG: DUF1554 domain-containing protein [Spirochaetia bacterium]|nr:DUF1554 domain-containing protein [Spirochaetia bacterium]
MSILVLVSCSSPFKITALFKGDASLIVSVKSLDLTEGGTPGAFNVSLASKPTSPVSIAFLVSDLAEARISPQNLTFTSDDFSTPQTITVYPLMDCKTDGTKNITIKTTQVISGDPLFQSTINPLLYAEVAVSVKDNVSRIPQLMIQSNNSVLTTGEDAKVDKFLVSLSCPPATGEVVTVNLASTNTNEGVVDVSSAGLDKNNYSMGALVTVTGQPDCILNEPDINYTVTANSISSLGAGSLFNNLSTSIGAVNKNVNLVPQLLLLNSYGQLNRGAGSYNNFQVMLSCAPPTGTMTMSTTLTGLTAPVLWSPFGPPAGNYIFNTTNWKTPVDVIVQVTNDNDGAYSINLTSDQPATYSPLAINVADSGMRKLNINVTGSTGLLTIKNGTDTFQINGVQTYTINYPTNTAYQFYVSANPAGQVCAFKEKQFGTFGTTTMTLNINCVNGQMVGGRFQALAPAPLDYRLYQGKVATYFSTAVGDQPEGVAIAGGNLYYVNRSTHQIFKCTAVNSCAIFAGSGTAGTSDGASTVATFYTPRGMVSDGTNLYVTQRGDISVFGTTSPDDAIRKIDSAGNVTTLLNSGLKDSEGLALAGNTLYISNRFDHTIKTLDLSTGNLVTIAGTTGVSGSTDSTQGTSATFNEPIGLTILNGILYVTEFSGHKIRGINLNDPNHGVSTLAGTGVAGFQDGLASQAKFNGPTGMTTDGTDLYVIDYLMPRIRKIKMSRTPGSTNHIVSTLAGDGVVYTTPVAGTGILARFNSPLYITTDGRTLYVTDAMGGVVNKITDNGLVGYWPLAGNANDYNSDNPTAAPGNIINGTSTAWPTLTASSGRFGNDSAYSFNGAQYISALQNAAYTSNTITVAAWIKPSSLPAAGAVYSIVDKRDNGVAPWNGWTLELFNSASGQTIVWNCNNGGGAANFTVDTTKWTHVAAVQSGTAIKLYANGKLLSSANTCVGPTDSNLPLLIGKRSDGNFFQGAISDVRIYARALGEGEINELAQDADPTLVGQSYNTGATGLLSHYSFDASGATPSLLDSGSLNYPLTNSTAPATTATGKDGDANGAFGFSGTSQYLSTGALVSDGLSVGSSMTVSVWVNPTALPPTNMIYGIVDRHTSQQKGGYVLQLWNNGGTQYIYWTPNFWNNSCTATYTLPLNAWTHIAVSLNGTTSTMYVNGKTVALAGDCAALSVETGNPPINIGYRPDPNDPGHFPGKIDDVRIYNNALTAAQVRQLAVQVPTGLVARYDFTGDANDVSGWGNNAGSATATATTDRFTQASSAYNFAKASNQSIVVPHTQILNPQGSITLSAWVKPAAYPASGQTNFIVGKDIYGSSGYGLELYNNAGTQEIVWVTPGGSGPHYAFTLPLNVWSQLSVTQTGTTIILYVNGAAIQATTATAGTGVALNPTTTQNFVIGNDSVAAGYFDGAIDDVRVYNRVLTQGEIQALVQQPNKRIFVTTSTYTGDLRTAGAGTGIAGADAKCMADANHPDAAQTLANRRLYKAMLVDGTNRQACTTANCATPPGNLGIAENIDWVLRPNVTYTRADGITPVFTADWNGVYQIGSAAGSGFVNSISGGQFFSGMRTDWVTNSTNSCTAWTVTSGSAAMGNGSLTLLDTNNSWNPIGSINGNGCNTAFPIACVEQ